MTYCDSFAVANCDGCGLCNKIKLFSQIPEDREIIVISQVPSDRDTVLAEFHSGNGGMILKPLLVDFKVAYINATLCSPIMTEAETKDLAACRKRFHADLLHAIMVNPELKGILVFGAKAHTEFKKFFNSKMVKDACEDKKVADMIDCARESG